MTKQQQQQHPNCFSMVQEGVCCHGCINCSLRKGNEKGLPRCQDRRWGCPWQGGKPNSDLCLFLLWFRRLWYLHHIFQNSEDKVPYYVQFSSSVMSDSLQPHGPQHARHPCPSPTPRACSNSCLSSWWYNPTISSSVIPFSSHLVSFPASGSFQRSQFFVSGGQSVGSFSFTISPFNENSELISFRVDWLDLLAVQGTLKSLLQHHSSKASIFWCSAFFIVQLSHPYMTTGKTIALTRQTFAGKVMSLLFNMLSTFISPIMLLLVTQWCTTVCDPLDCSLPGSSVHGIIQARTLDWVAISFCNSVLLSC